MNKIGFVKSDKKNEQRRAILPNFKFSKVLAPFIYVEKGYGEHFGFTDEDYTNCGINVVDRTEIFEYCEIICDPKLGDANYLNELPQNKILFGWMHAVQNQKLADYFVENNHTVIAWEDMHDDGLHIFRQNNYIAGEAAILHGLVTTGVYPDNLNVAIIGNGNTSKGAQNILKKLEIDYTIYNRSNINDLNSKIDEYDILINAILWDTNRKDHIVYKEDLNKMKRNAVIIDISCDRAGAIETSKPTSIDNPTYIVEGIKHYVVDHTPSLFPLKVSEVLSNIVIEFIEDLINAKSNPILEKATIIKDGIILDKRIIGYKLKYSSK